MVLKNFIKRSSKFLLKCNDQAPSKNTDLSASNTTVTRANMPRAYSRGKHSVAPVTVICKNKFDAHNTRNASVPHRFLRSMKGMYGGVMLKSYLSE